MLIPLTGTQYEISAGDYAAVVTELGAGLRSLRHRSTPLLAGYEPGQLPPGGAGQLLAPWPNRVDGGRYSFDGAQLQLDLSEPAAGNAIHGLTRWATWVPVEREANRVLLRQALRGHPDTRSACDIDAEYRVEPDAGLQVAVTARNQGRDRAPYGTGSHPYLTAGTPMIDACELTLPRRAGSRPATAASPRARPQDVDGTPFDFRAAGSLGGLRLDHAVHRSGSRLRRAGLGPAGRPGAASCSGRRGVPWLQVFTGDPLDEQHRRRALAVEPMTCPPNAFVSGTDLLVIEPGQRPACLGGPGLAG